MNSKALNRAMTPGMLVIAGAGWLLAYGIGAEGDVATYGMFFGWIGTVVGGFLVGIAVEKDHAETAAKEQRMKDVMRKVIADINAKAAAEDQP